MPILKLDGDATGAVKATADVNAKAKELSNTFKEVSGSTDKVAESHGHAFGSHALGELASYAAGLLTVHTVIEKVTEALREQSEEKKRAAENVAAGLAGAGAIANVSRSQGEFDRNAAFASRLMDEGIFKRSDQDSANRAAASIAASGASASSRDFLVDIGRQKRVGGGELGEFSMNVARFRESFGAEAGSFEDVAKQFIRAGSDTLGVTSPSDIGRQAADIADAAKENGISPTKALAAYTAFARTTKSARRAAQLTRDWIEGKSDMSKDQAAQFATETQNLQGAPSAKLQDFVGGNKRFAGARGGEEAEGRLSGLIEQQLADRESLYNTISTESETWEAQHGYGGFHRALGRMARGAVHFAGGEEGQIAGYGKDAKEQRFRNELTPETRKRVDEWLETQTEIQKEQLEIMRRGDRQPPGPNGRQE